MDCVEGEIHIDFTKATSYRKLDEQRSGIPPGMSLVDCFVEEEDRFLFVEIKDPSCEPKSSTPKAKKAVARNRERFFCDTKSEDIINNHLVPKARDSYTYIHLMSIDSKEIIYVFLIGEGAREIDKKLLVSFKDRLLSRIRQEADIPWKRHYVKDCVVLTEKSWKTVFPEYPITRRDRSVP